MRQGPAANSGAPGFVFLNRRRLVTVLPDQTPLFRLDEHYRNNPA